MPHDDSLDCDIETILQCRDNEEFDVLQRLSASCQEFRARVAASIDSYIAHAKGYDQKCEATKEQIAHLHINYKDIIKERDEIVLKQKVTDKKMAIDLKQQAKFIEDIEDAKLRKESIALELVDLMHEFEDGKKQRKDQWNAIKMACFIYKEKLDFHLDFKQCDDHERIQITFFRNKNPDRTSYYVHLLKYKNHWKVAQIEPPLKDIHQEEIKTVIDFTKPLDVSDVTAFLCKLKSVFASHYLNN